MNDAERSIAVCLSAFAEYQRSLKHEIRSRHEATLRIAVQIAKGRVQNTQVANTIDFRPVAEVSPERLSDGDVEHAMSDANKWFRQWHEDLSVAIAERRDGWLRLSIKVKGGSVISGSTNPSFDFKPT